MNNTERLSAIKQFFEYGEFQAYADAIPQGILAIDHEGLITFANQQARALFTLDDTVTPFTHYRDTLPESDLLILELIDDTLAHKREIYRQVTKNEQIYLVESKIVYHNKLFTGCIISLADITNLALKERQHELLYQISSALSGVTNISLVLRIALSQILKSMQITSANIMLYHPRTHALQIHFDTNKPLREQAPRSIQLGEGMAGRAALELKPYSAYDIATSDLFARKTDDDKGALLCVPIATKGKLLGVLNIRDDQPRYFSEVEVQFLRIIANEIAIAIENSRLYERMRRKIRLLARLSSISSLMIGKNIESRVHQLVKLAPELLEAEDCCVYLHAPGSYKLVLKYQKTVASPLALQVDLRKPSTVATVYNERKAVLLNEIESKEAIAEFAKYNPKSIISIPICAQDKVIGVITVFNKHTGGFTEEDRHLLTILAHRMSTKIENVQLLRKVESEKELLDKIIENISEGVAVLNRKQKIIIWNRHMEELTGLNSADAIHNPAYRIFFHKLNLKELTQYIYTAPIGTHILRKPRFCELELKSVDGDKKWISCIYSYILDQHGEVENMIILFRNMSKERELIEAKNEFVSMATHELRTPLTAIRGYLSMILQGDTGSITAQQKSYFMKAYASTERLSDLVEDLLEVVRIEENRLKLSPEVFLVNDAIEEITENLSQVAQAKHITLKWTGTVPIHVRADMNKTKEILENLIDNAIKYTRNKGLVTISLEKRERDVIISIKDNGVGIPAKHLATIFERFVRVPNSLSVKAGGTGLGLYIVKNLVEKQGGTIWVTSQVGKETTFHFTLPLARCESHTKTKAREE